MTSIEVAIHEIDWRKTDKLLVRDDVPTNTRDGDETRAILKHLKTPPDGYRFSLPQQQEQWLFVQQYQEQLPMDSHLDIFDMRVLAICTLMDRTDF